MKIPFPVIILAMAATPVFSSYSSFLDLMTKISEEPKAEPEQLTWISRDDGEGQIFRDADTSELDKELDEILKLLEGSQKSETMWDRLFRKDEKPQQSLLDVLFSDKDENAGTLFDTQGKSMAVKQYFPEDFFNKKK